MLSLLRLSEQSNPKAAVIVRGRLQVGFGFNKGISKEYETSPIYEAIQEYYRVKFLSNDISDMVSVLFCSYFPSLQEFIALYSTDIRTVYFIGDITDETTVRFLNDTSGQDFEIIKLEMV